MVLVLVVVGHLQEGGGPRVVHVVVKVHDVAQHQQTAAVRVVTVVQAVLHLLVQVWGTGGRGRERGGGRGVVSHWCLTPSQPGRLPPREGKAEGGRGEGGG